ncbi:Panacea domain-containing protein [Akkermansiaceae bacterium]|nr:Panacea domain-containing protein [Akkermansiaceae bacterium]
MSTLEEYFSALADVSSVRINIPQKNIEKFKQVLLYLLQKVGARPNVGQTVLYKLLYFIDFDYYEKHEEQLMGLTYIKNTYGPTPREFKAVVDEMISEGSIDEVKAKHFALQQRKYLPVVSPDLSKLSGQELAMIDSVIHRYGDCSATQISELSHEDTPWQIAKDKENIEYEYAFYRSERFSVREYSAL